MEACDSPPSTTKVGLSNDSLKQSYEIDHSEVDMTEAALLGEVAYSDVYLVKWRGVEVAARTISSSIASSPTLKKAFLNEMTLWQNLCHPNIVQFLGVLKHPGQLIFLTEYLRNGSLYHILGKKGRLDSVTAVSYALDIARGMNYLHQHKPHPLVHRNLTPRSLLLDETGYLKVTNFSLCGAPQEMGTYRMTGGTSSYRYMAPEVYRRESYGKGVDVFSFALVVHEMFQGFPSNKKTTPEVVVDKRAYEDRRPPLPTRLFPEHIKILLRDCWHKNPNCRPTFEEIIVRLEMIQEIMIKKRNIETCSKCSIL